MSDVYAPGLKSRFNSEKIVEDLMKIERLPKEKTEKNIEELDTRKTWWQDLGRRVTSLRESARLLYSFQNPFNERAAISSNEKIITATATRQADEREYQFTVQQLALADRYLSPPLDEKTTVEAGDYTFSVGKDEISFNFKGGTLKEFADLVNRRGGDKVSASVLTVQPGTRSLLVESKVTGEENRLGFSGPDMQLAASMQAVSVAQDAIISMEGIEMTRPSNTFSDIIPGMTITAKGVSETPEQIEIQADREGIKNSIISMVGNYNRLMAEINVLTSSARESSSGVSVGRKDGRIIDELDQYWWISREETEDMRERLGAFAGDSTLLQLRSNLLRAVSSPYTTGEDQSVSMLTQIGVSTKGSGGAGYNLSGLRGYLEIDEKALDTAIEQHLPAIKQLFASSTSGDIIPDTGVAVNVEALAKPFVELGGIISLKTGTIDSKITQDKRRIDTMERQLAAKEMDLKLQYSRMEDAYARMEKMSTALDGFSRQNSNNR